MLAQYYECIYLLVVSLLTIVVTNQYSRFPEDRINERFVSSNMTQGAFFVTIIMALFIGFRPHSTIFTDMGSYALDWRLKANEPFEFSLDKENFLYDNLYGWLRSLRIDSRYFFVMMAVFYFGFMFWACQKLFPKDSLLALLVILGSFSTFSYGTNGIKAGVAASIFLCALSYSRQFLPCLIFLLLSWGTHHSMQLPVVAYVICTFYRNPRLYIFIWIFCLFLSILHVTFFEQFFASMSDERGAGYLLNENEEFVSRFRPDFVFYSALPILLGYWVLFKTNYQSAVYNHIFSTYLLSNSVWMLCMYVQFNNRIAYLSWLMIPFVIIYPFLDKEFVYNQYKKANAVTWCNLGFTLLMVVVYYGILGLGN